MSLTKEVELTGPRHRYSSYLILIRVAFWLTITRVALWILPFRSVTNLLKIDLETPPELSEVNLAYEKKVVWAIDALSRRLPIFRNCLNRAIAAQLLLRNGGSTARLLIGVTRNPQGEFKAHAWVERNGEIVIGTLPDLATYKPLRSLHRKTI
jgi:hypothetical protein